MNSGLPFSFARLLAIAVALIAAVTAHAGIVLTRDDGAVISIDGERYRIDLPASGDVRTHDVVISHDRDVTAIHINDQNRTWYRRGEGRLPGSWFSTSRRFGDRNSTLKAPATLVTARKSGDAIAGLATEVVTLQLSYELQAHAQQARVSSKVKAAFLFWVSPDLPQAIRPVIHTPFEDVNKQIRAVLNDLKGLVLAESASVTQTYAGGKPFTETKNWRVVSIEKRDLPPSMFETPAGYTHQAPQLAAPGL